MDAATALDALGEPVATRSQLLVAGATPRDLTEAVRSRRLIRAREGYYALPSVDPMVLQAVRIGGRLGCVSALERYGVWVEPHPFPHVSVDPHATRLRTPRNRFRPLTAETRDGCELHWQPTIDGGAATIHTVAIVDALLQALWCQPRELAVAALDSALYKRLATRAQIDRVFAAVPRRLALLRESIDGRCMSGIETIIRLELVTLGVPFELQVAFRGVGTVDFVVAGCVVIETDGHLGHRDAASAVRDYERDVALAALGYIVVRLNYRQVMFQRSLALAAILGALRSHRRGPAI
jgi:very-short-patch-repair endonuclease